MTRTLRISRWLAALAATALPVLLAAVPVALRPTIVAGAGTLPARVLPAINGAATGREPRLLAAARRTGSNLLTNPGGEIGNVDDQAYGWTYLGYGALAAIADDAVRSGARSIKIDQYAYTPGAQGSYSHQSIAVSDGQVLRFSGWIRTGARASATGDARLHVHAFSGVSVTRIGIRGDDVAPTSVDVGLQFQTRVRDWTYVESTFRVSGSGTIWVYVMMDFPNTGLPGAAWFDDLRLETIDESDPPEASAPAHATDELDRSRCVANCFDITAGYATTPYVSLNQPRSFGLFYRSSSIDLFTTVELDVSDPAAPVGSTTHLRLRNRATGSYYTFTNGTTAVTFTNAPGVARIAARFSLPGDCQGQAIPVVAEVRRRLADSTLGSVREVPIRLLRVDESCSRFGKGWAVTGVSRVRTFATDSLVRWDADGSVGFYARQSEDTHRYYYRSPVGDHSALTQEKSTVQGATYLRRFPSGLVNAYDANGYLAWSAGRHGDSVHYAWSAPADTLQPMRLDSIVDPAGLVTSMTYDSRGYLQAITDPMGRVTAVTVDAYGHLTELRDASNALAFLAEYHTTYHWLMALTDRGGNRTTYAFDFAGKLSSITSPSVELAGLGMRELDTQFRSALTAALSNTSAGVPAPFVDAHAPLALVVSPRRDTTRFVLARHGAAERAVNALGNVTTFHRADTANPTAVTRIERTEGGVDRVTYTATGMPASTFTAGGDTTFVFYNATFPTQPDSVTGPGKATQRFHYTAAGCPIRCARA